MKSTKRVLVAASPESAERVRDALQEHFTLSVTSSLAEAQSLLAEDIAIVLCGLHFDEGKMFDLLRYAKADPMTREIPFLCVKSTEGVLSSVIFQGIEIASRALGADGFVELVEWKMAVGDEAAYEQLRQLVDRLINS
jgi:DNA-binding NarL/FixJ family response regulator